MAAGTLPHVGGGAPFPCPIDASHDGRRPERSGLATAAAWPDRKFAGCLCWKEAYHQVFDALSVSSVLWQSQRSDALTSDEIGAASSGADSTFVSGPKAVLLLRVACQRCGSSTSPLIYLKPRAFQAWLEEGQQKFWECDTSTFTPTRIVVKMRRSASDGAPLAELLAQGR